MVGIERISSAPTNRPFAGLSRAFSGPFTGLSRALNGSVLPPNSAEYVRDLPHGRPRPHGVDDGLHQRSGAIARRGFEIFQRTFHPSPFSVPPQLTHSVLLRLRQPRVIRRRDGWDALVVHVLVHTDDDRFAGLDRPLLRVGALRDGLLEEAALDGARGTTHPLDLVDQFPRLTLDPLRQR